MNIVLTILDLIMFCLSAYKVIVSFDKGFTTYELTYWIISVLFWAFLFGKDIFLI